jgi:hypothetical protein
MIYKISNFSLRMWTQYVLFAYTRTQVRNGEGGDWDLWETEECRSVERGHHCTNTRTCKNLLKIDSCSKTSPFFWFATNLHFTQQMICKKLIYGYYTV